MVLSYHVGGSLVNITLNYYTLSHFIKVHVVFWRLMVPCFRSNPNKELFEVSGQGAYDREQDEESEGPWPGNR
jgi:hypothetical protein